MLAGEERQAAALAANEWRFNRGDAYWGKLAVIRMQTFYQHIGRFVCEDDTAIDFGGVDGLAAEEWKKLTHNDMAVVDIVKECVDEANRHGIKAIHASIESLPFADEEVYWGFCSHTLEHTVDLDSAIAELKRVIKGMVFIVVPLEDDNDVKKNSSHNHHNPDPIWWEEKFKAAGFIVKWWQDGLNIYTPTDRRACDALYLCFNEAFFDEWNGYIQATHNNMTEFETSLHHGAIDVRLARVQRVMGSSSKGSWADFGGGDCYSKKGFKEILGRDVAIVDMVDTADIKCDLASTPIADAGYDWLFSSHTLEHVKHIKPVLAEMYRVCRRGAYIIVPLQSAQDIASYISHLNHSEDPDWWMAKCREVGFKVRQYSINSYFNGLPELDIWVEKA